MKRKYGPTLDDVIAFGADVARKLSEIENKDEILRELRADLAKAATEYLRAARALSKEPAKTQPANSRSWSRPRSTIWR